MKQVYFFRSLIMLIIISMINTTCMDENSRDSSTRNGSEMTDGGKSNLIITKIFSIPRSLAPGRSTQMILGLNSTCPATTPIELHQKCHNLCDQLLKYKWTTTCPGFFNDNEDRYPVFTTAPGAQKGQCTISVLVTNKCTQHNADTQLSILDANQPPEIVSSFQSTDGIWPGQDIYFIIRAKDPESSALSFTWSTTNGTFDTPFETVTEDYIESFVKWTAPDCGVAPINVSVDIKDSEGLVTKKTFHPIELIDGEDCP